MVLAPAGEPVKEIFDPPKTGGVWAGLADVEKPEQKPEQFGTGPLAVRWIVF